MNRDSAAAGSVRRSANARTAGRLSRSGPPCPPAVVCDGMVSVGTRIRQLTGFRPAVRHSRR